MDMVRVRVTSRYVYVYSGAELLDAYRWSTWRRELRLVGGLGLPFRGVFRPQAEAYWMLRQGQGHSPAYWNEWVVPLEVAA